MSLLESEAFYFLLAAVLLHWLLPRKAAVQNLALLALSWLFYAAAGPWLLVMLLGTTAVDWIVQQRFATASRRKAWLALSLGANLGVLFWFKYAGPTTESLGRLLASLGIPVAMPVLQLALPLGLSFYTLQRLGCVLDVYLGRRAPVRSPLTFATFTCFFPQLTAGPISRAGELLDQLERPRRLLPDQVARGCASFLLGYTLKCYVADSLGPVLVDTVYADPASHSCAALWIATAGYALQIFADFAGYSLIAIGVALWFGITLPTNFDYPFFSRSLPEFWRRWHITLNRWLFAFVYAPLTTSRGWFRGRMHTGLIVVFLASGIWHGSQWPFVIWGLLHGLGMAVHSVYDERYRQLCRNDRVWVERRRTLAYAAGAWILTQGFFVVTLVAFRARSLPDTLTIWTGMLGLGEGTQTQGRTYLPLLLIGAYHAFGLLPRAQAWVLALPAPVRGVLYGLVIVALLMLVPVGTSTFIYRNF